MGGNFYDIVRCVGVGFREIGDHHFVNATGDSTGNARAPSAVRGRLGGRQIDEIAEYGSPRFQLSSSSQHRLGYGFGLSPGHTNHPDPSPAGRGSNGYDGVV
jgi:hypothetical protein